MRNDLSGHFKSLVAIHAAPGWLWGALVEAMVEAVLLGENGRTGGL